MDFIEKYLFTHPRIRDATVSVTVEVGGGENRARECIKIVIPEATQEQIDRMLLLSIDNTELFFTYSQLQRAYELCQSDRR